MRQQNFKIFHRIENYVIELICAGDIFSVSLWHVDEEYLICEYGAIEPFCGEPLVDYYKRKCRIKYNGEIACALTPDDPIDEEALKEAVYLFAKENGMDFDPR